MNIVSAKYLYDEDGTTKTHIQLNLGTNDAGDTYANTSPSIPAALHITK